MTGAAATETSPADLARRVRRLEIRARRLVAERLYGQYASVFRGRGLEFSEVRAYQPGDDVRIIDWNVTARMSVPYVKKFVEERELSVLVAVDLSGSQQFGTQAATKAELAAELTAVLTFSAVANNDLAGLLAFTDRVESYVAPAKGARQGLRIVREILALEPEGRGTNIGEALNYLQRTLRHRVVIFLISDFIDSSFEATLRYAAKRHDVVALALLDPGEMSLPDIGLVEVEDPETGARRWLDTSSRKTRAGFQERATGAREARMRNLASLGVDVVPVRTDRDYVAPLTAYLRARARRH